MPAVPPPLCLLWGPPGHGVTDYGVDVAAAASAIDPAVASTTVTDLDSALRTVAAAAGPRPRVHLHATDRLLGPSLEQAADAVEALAAVSRLTLTLHDVPQESDGTKYARRVAAYTRFAAAAEAIAVNSGHERMLLAEHLPDAPEPRVIPLGTRLATPPRAPAHLPRPHDLIVLVAGYVYPGKGHDLALRAAVDAVETLRAAGHPVGRAVVRALGSASPGHDADVDRLRSDAARLGAGFEISGFLADDDFAAALRAPGIPVAAHAHVSASRSMLDAVEAGRRPLVVRSRYSEEMDALRPGTTSLFAPAELAARLVSVWLDPGESWLRGGQSLRPTLDDVARDYLAWWSERGRS